MAKPKLRFPEFTDEWEEKQLKDFMFFKNGLNADKDKFGSGIKFISVMDILNNPFITYDVIRGKVNIDEKTLDNYSVTYGDVLFQRSSETREDAGKSNVYLDKEKIATFGGFVIRGKKIGDYSPEFMNSLLKSPKVRKEITSKAQGAQHINVGQETLENVSIALPQLIEQQKIADFLSSVDDIIQVHEEEIFALEEQKKGVMQKLFNREVRFKADDGSEYPEWEEKKLGECILIQRGGSPRPIESYMTNADDGINWIKIGDAPINGNIITSVKEKIKPEGKKKSREVFVGDLILSNSMSFGRPYILDVNGCIHDGWLLLRDEKKKFDLKYLCYLLSSNSVLLQYKKLAAGSAVNNLNSDLVQSVRINYPSKEEQQKIADCLSAYDEVIQIKKDKLEIWKEIKKGLLQQMFV